MWTDIATTRIPNSYENEVSLRPFSNSNEMSFLNSIVLHLIMVNMRFKHASLLLKFEDFNLWSTRRVTPEVLLLRCKKW